MDKIHEEIIGMSHTYFLSKVVTPDSIREFLERMQRAYPDATLDIDGLFRRLESAHSVSIGTASMLDDRTDHEEWFNPSTNRPVKRDFAWHFWDHYRQYLTTIKRWPPRVVNSIDSLSSEILSRLEDPKREGGWDRRGMVMGSVQSGKTANYTALITKAADSGYKLFIVLAGVHNSLRSQTQTRLNEEFLGYDLDKVQKLTGAERRIGVRQLFLDHHAVYTLTNSSEKGDFSKPVAEQSGIFPDPNSSPIILIIKKNVTILKNLIRWITSVIGHETSEGRGVIPGVPVLVIDDECDFASINTKQPERDEKGNIIKEWDPTATNRYIRQLVHLFEKSAYVGYTATPYANIFIHKDDTHPSYGEDLFPRSFIISLPQPTNYIGPDRVFGLEEDRMRGIEETEPLPLLRDVGDHEQAIPDRHKADATVSSLPDSLRDAIRSFMLSCAVRSMRGEGPVHNSMLIHVTRFTNVQRQVHELVEREMRTLSARIMSGEELDDFRRLWNTDFVSTSRWMRGLGFRDAIEHSWDDVLEHLHSATRGIRVKLINGTVRDTLDYKDAEINAAARMRRGEEVPWEERGTSVIAIGGDKLSRGLTLEGLTVSYYLRASRMYDTLMQMGRWFGYRDGYSDLCRIYTTEELASWYRHIAGATRELREEIEYMSALGKTPMEFGLKVRSHTGRLVVTSAGKSRNKQKVPLSYAGKISETVVFDPRNSRNNLRMLERLIKAIGRGCDYEHEPEKPRFHWKNVPGELVIDFLRGYRTQEEASRVVNPEWMAGYIEEQNKNGELTSWNVVLVSVSDTEHTVIIGDHRVGCVKRTPILPVTRSKISLRRLVSPTDESLDLSEEEKQRARKFDRERLGKDIGDRDPPSGISVRHIRPLERGLLLIYIPQYSADPVKTYGSEDGEETVGFAISFPHSDTARPVEYWINPVYAEEEDHYI